MSAEVVTADKQEFHRLHSVPKRSDGRSISGTSTEFLFLYTRQMTSQLMLERRGILAAYFSSHLVVLHMWWQTWWHKCVISQDGQKRCEVLMHLNATPVSTLPHGAIVKGQDPAS